MNNAATLALCASIIGCGGGDGPLSTAHAQAQAQIEIARLHCVLRPDSNGRWYVQDDADHASIGIDGIEQTADYVRILFDRRYTHAGVIQVTSDDDFRGRVSGHSNLGVTSATIKIVANGSVIDPSTVNNYVPAGSGNLWVSVTMMNKP